MNYRLANPTQYQLQELIEIRLAAMRPSLIAIGRYDPERAVKRFTDGYDPELTTCIIVSEKIVGFFVLAVLDDHLLLDHFYIRPESQGHGIGASIISSVKILARTNQRPVRLSALRGSDANKFYKHHGFVETHVTEFDIHYQFSPQQGHG